MDRLFLLRSGLLLTALFLAVPSAVRAEETVKITVIAILASENHKEVDKRLSSFASEVQKKNPSLTGFRVAQSTTSTLKLGVTQTIPLADGQSVDVTANASQTEKGTITITIKPPKISQITYNCVCERYFSMATQHFTKDKEQLFFAVTGKPCAGPEKDKEKSLPAAKSK